MVNVPSDEEVNDLDLLPAIARKLGINPHQMDMWAKPDRRKSIGFPEPKARMGRYRLFSVSEVERWVKLWSRVSKNFGGGFVARKDS